MIHHVVVFGAPPVVARLAPRLLDALTASRVFEGEPVQHVAADGTWAVGALDLPDPMSTARLAVGPDAMAVVNGPALVTAGDQAQLGRTVLDAFLAGGTDAVTARLNGGYNVVAVGPGAGLRALSGFSGIAPLYWHQGDGFAAFSTRSSTLAELVGDRARDPRALAWILGDGNVRGDGMPFRAARYLGPGVQARVDPGGTRVAVERSPVWIWPEPSDGAGRDDLSEGEWDEVTASLVDGFRALRSFGRPVRLSLSGGKDSRLCLALAKAAGLDDVVLLRTNGGPDSPEVECAAAVAAAAGLPHERIPTAGEAAGAADLAAAGPTTDVPDGWWSLLRQHVYRYEGIVSPWDGTMRPMRTTTLNIRGIGGELYRRGNIKKLRQVQPKKVGGMVKLHAQGCDPLGALPAPLRAELEAWRTEWFEVTARHVRADLLPEKWYVDYRLGQWNGPLAQAKAGYINVVPLLTPLAARKNMELSATQRSGDRFHFEVMRRTAPALAQVPFLDDTWSPLVAATSPIPLATAPYPVAVQPTLRALSRPKWDFLEVEADAIVDLLREADRTTDLGAVCSVGAVEHAIGTTDLLGAGKVKQIFSAIGIALALLDRTEPSIDRLARYHPDDEAG
jgi:hypothetical protein